jgi:hypothetical protein
VSKVSMMTFSLAWSTSVTKSLAIFCDTRTDSTSSAARLMIAAGGTCGLDGHVEHGVDGEEEATVMGGSAAAERTRQ